MCVCVHTVYTRKQTFLSYVVSDVYVRVGIVGTSSPEFCGCYF